MAIQYTRTNDYMEEKLNEYMLNKLRNNIKNSKKDNLETQNISHKYVFPNWLNYFCNIYNFFHMQINSFTLEDS